MTDEAESTQTLRWVVLSARKAASAREDLHTAIREARAAGVSLRAIAAAANLSHEHVRRIAP